MLLLLSTILILMTYFCALPLVRVEFNLTKTPTHADQWLTITCLLVFCLTSFHFYTLADGSLLSLYLLLNWTLFTLSYIDSHYYLLSPILLWLHILCCLLIIIYTHSFTLLKGITCLLFFLTCSVINYFFENSLGKGDIKLLSTWALTFPFIHFWSIIMIASSLGLLSVFIKQARKTNNSVSNHIPFVPYLYLGFVCQFLFF